MKGGPLLVLLALFIGANGFYFPYPCNRTNAIPGINWIGAAWDVRYQERENAYLSNVTIFPFQFPFKNISWGYDDTQNPFLHRPDTYVLKATGYRRRYCVPSEIIANSVSEFGTKTVVFVFERNSWLDIQSYLADNIGIPFQTGMFGNSTDISVIKLYKKAYSELAAYATETYDHVGFYQLHMMPQTRSQLSASFENDLMFLRDVGCVLNVSLEEYKRVNFNADQYNPQGENVNRCFLSFVSKWGTHYVRSVVMGGSISFSFSAGKRNVVYDQPTSAIPTVNITGLPSLRQAPELDENVLRSVSQRALKHTKNVIRGMFRRDSVGVNTGSPLPANYEFKDTRFEVVGGAPELKEQLKLASNLLTKGASVNNFVTFSTLLGQRNNEDIFGRWESSVIDNPEPTTLILEDITRLTPKELAPYLKHDIDYMISQAAKVPERPAAPVVFTIDSHTVSLVWLAPIDNSALITGYLISISSGDYLGNGGTIFDFDLPKTLSIPATQTTRFLTQVVQGLQPDCRYQFSVAAINRVGQSEMSVPGTNVTDGSTPGVISVANVTVKEIGGRYLIFQFIDARDNGRAMVKYSIDSNATFSKQNLTNLVPPPGPQTFRYDSLCPLTYYEFFMQAENEDGRGQYSGRFGATTTVSAPLAITELVWENRYNLDLLIFPGLRNVTITWKASSACIGQNSDNNPGFTNWTISLTRTAPPGPLAVYSYSAAQLNDKCSKAPCSITTTLFGLTPASQYSLNVYGCNVVGCAPASFDLATYTAYDVGQPTNVSCGNNSFNYFELLWQEPPYEGLKPWWRFSFIVYLSSDYQNPNNPSGGNSFAVLSNQTRLLHVNGLIPSTNYTIVMRVDVISGPGAFDEVGGTGIPVVFSCQTAPPNPPSRMDPPTTQDLGGFPQGIMVRWIKPDENGATIEAYQLRYRVNNNQTYLFPIYSNGFTMTNLTEIPATNRTQLYIQQFLVLPTTGQPTTAQPTTAVPTTAVPTTAQATTRQATTAQATTAQATTSNPTTGVIPSSTGQVVTAQATTAQATTAQATTAQPTTAQPTTAIPTTAVPTTAVPTTAVPTTGFPADYESVVMMFLGDAIHLSMRARNLAGWGEWSAESNYSVVLVTTGVPTTAIPTTAQPTTRQPTTAQPTTAIPTTAVPTTAQATTAQATTAQATTGVATTVGSTGSVTTAASTGVATTA